MSSVPLQKPSHHHPSFDEAQFATVFHGMEDIAIETILSLVANLPKMITAVETAIAEKSPGKLELSAHSIKGSLLNFHAGPAGLLAWKLEQMGHGPVDADAEKVFTELKTELARLVIDLQAYANERKPA